jgi:hypothetical protein
MTIHSAIRDLIDALAEELSTVDDDSAHGPTAEERPNTARHWLGEPTLRHAAAILALQIGDRAHRYPDHVAVALGRVPHHVIRSGGFIAKSHAVAVEAVALTADTADDPETRSRVLRDFLACADRFQWDNFNLVIGAAHLAAIISVAEDPQPDDVDRGWAASFTTGLRSLLQG